MVRFLARRGAEVTEAADGVQRWSTGGFEPHVILADLRMPKMDGASCTPGPGERPALAERSCFSRATSRSWRGRPRSRGTRASTRSPWNGRVGARLH